MCKPPYNHKVNIIKPRQKKYLYNFLEFDLSYSIFHLPSGIVSEMDHMTRVYQSH